MRPTRNCFLLKTEQFQNNTLVWLEFLTLLFLLSVLLPDYIRVSPTKVWRVELLIISSFAMNRPTSEKEFLVCGAWCFFLPRWNWFRGVASFQKWATSTPDLRAVISDLLLGNKEGKGSLFAYMLHLFCSVALETLPSLRVTSSLATIHDRVEGDSALRSLNEFLH